VQMRSGHPPRLTNEPDRLPAHHRVTLRHQRLAHVEIPSDDTSAMIDVDHRARQKEGVDQSDDAAVGRANRIADGSAEIDAEMPARDSAVEHPAVPERTGDNRGSWTKECCRPERRRLVRTASDVTRAGILAVDPCRGFRAHRLRERAVDGERL